MKKYISILLLLVLCISVFAGCESNTPKITETGTSNSWSANFTSRDAAVPAPLSEEDAAALEALLSSDAWINDLTKCEFDVSIESSSGDRYDYHSECGTFNDRNSKRYLSLDDEDKTLFNDLLRKYGRLSIDDVISNTDMLLTEPPVLTVRSSDGSLIEAMRGTTSWTYDNEDGTRSGFEADSAHPLDCKEYMPTLTLIPMIYSSKHPLEMFLHFDVAPDSVAVRCWSEEHWGDPNAESTPLELYPDILEGGYLLVGYGVGYIYEVIAQWNGYERFEGSVCYSFYAKPMAGDSKDENKNVSSAEENKLHNYTDPTNAATEADDTKVIEYQKVNTLKADGIDTTILVKFNGTLFGKSFVRIDYANVADPIGEVNKLIDKDLTPQIDGETNTQELLGALVYECSEESAVLYYSNVYYLFERIG